MNNYREILVTLAWRGAVAAVVYAAGWVILARAQGGWGAVGALLIGMGCIVGSATVVGGPLARLAAESCGGLFYPERHSRRPAPAYSVAEARRKSGLHEEAIERFEAIAREYPGELKPHVELIDIAVVDLRDPARAKAFLDRGLAALHKPRDRETLQRMYDAILTRFADRAPIDRPTVAFRRDTRPNPRPGPL